MLSTGKMKPDSSTFGSIVPSSAPIIATRCDEVRAETRMPSDERHQNEQHALEQQQQHAAAQRHAKHQTRLDDDGDHADESDRPDTARPCRR